MQSFMLIDEISAEKMPLKYNPIIAVKTNELALSLQTLTIFQQLWFDNQLR